MEKKEKKIEIDTRMQEIQKEDIYLNELNVELSNAQSHNVFDNKGCINRITCVSFTTVTAVSLTTAVSYPNHG